MSSRTDLCRTCGHPAVFHVDACGVVKSGKRCKCKQFVKRVKRERTRNNQEEITDGTNN